MLRAARPAAGGISPETSFPGAARAVGEVAGVTGAEGDGDAASGHGDGGNLSIDHREHAAALSS